MQLDIILSVDQALTLTAGTFALGLKGDKGN